MELSQVMTRLEALGDESVRTRNRKRGAQDDRQFGVMLGNIRKLAREVGRNHELALELWATGNIDARLLGILLLTPKKLTEAELERMVRDAGFVQVAEWLDSYVVRKRGDRESFREGWLSDPNIWAARAGWSLTAERIGKDPAGLDLDGLLDRIEAEMADAHPEPQWTMNNCLAGIGIHHPRLRERAISIGETLGVLRDYPTPKGCTSPFAPLWIAEMVRRNG